MSRHDARERDSWRRQISAYIVNELKPALRPAIERELRACRECRSYYEQEQALHDRRRGLDSVTPPQGLRRDVFAKIEREKATWLPAGLQLPSLGAVVTVVTLIALAFLVPQIFQLVRSGQFEQQALPPRLSVQTAVSPLPTVAVQPAALDTPSASSRGEAAAAPDGASAASGGGRRAGVDHWRRGHRLYRLVRCPYAGGVGLATTDGCAGRDAGHDRAGGAGERPGDGSPAGAAAGDGP